MPTTLAAASGRDNSLLRWLRSDPAIAHRRSRGRPSVSRGAVSQPRGGSMITAFGWMLVIGYNAEPSLRFGVHRERGPHSFVAVGLWPLLFAFGRNPEA